MEEHNKPFIQRKSTIAVGLGFLFFLIVAASIGQGSNSGPGSVSSSTQGKGSNGEQSGLGSAGQTAEFNQTFAARLREEQAKEIVRVEAEVKRELDAKFAVEAEKIRQESRGQQQELLQRLDALTAAQKDAAAALEEKSRQDAAKAHKFVAPRPLVDPRQISSLDQVQVSPDGISQTKEPASKPVIPPNGFVRGRLLNGVVATVGDAPTAFLVALEGTYKAANGFSVNLNGCMATVEGRPNLAAGRIDGKPAEITCNFEQEGRVQTWQVAGWLVDASDGLRGLNSIIVDNTGKKITAAALAQSLAVAGQTLNEAQYSSSSSAGGVTRTFSGSPEKAIAGGALTGAGQGLNTAIAEHYALYKPTLQKGANSPVTLVITNELPVPQQGTHITNNTNTLETRKQ
jgi:conjugal transfer pilus assembly protein TraB